MIVRPYSKYRDSGLRWLGAIPAHWDLVRTKHLFSERVEKGFPDEPLLAATQTKGVVRKEHYENRTVVASKDLHLLKLVEKGDYVISLRSFQGGIEYAHIRGIISPAYTILKSSSQAKPDFFRFFFKSRAFVDALTLFVTGIRQGQNIDYSRLSREPLPVPSEEEQLKIGTFLRPFVAKINQLIRAKQDLIRLLNEQKQAIIHRAVTRGLDPNVRLKPSGIDWLGDVPEHWEVIRLARVISDGPKNGISPAIDERGTIESFSISAIRDGKVEVRPSDIKYIVDYKEALNHAYSLLRGDVLLVRGNGNIRLVGKSGLVENDMPRRVYPDLLMRVRVTPRCLPQYLIALLNDSTGRAQIETAARTAVGTFKINNQQVRQLSFAFPPVTEQWQILSSLAETIAPGKSAAHRAADEVTLLRDYRTRLIADVVTGKLDVRGVELPAVDELEELQALDSANDIETDALDETEELVYADD